MELAWSNSQEHSNACLLLDFLLKFKWSEYIIGYLDVPDGEAPQLSQIAEHVTNFMHLLEGKITPNVVEIFSGYEVYFVDTLTHNEAFQLQQGDSIDFPAEDVTKIEGQS